MNITGSRLPAMADFSHTLPNYRNNGTDQLHTSQFSPKEMDFKIIKVLPEEFGTSTEEVNIKMPDGSFNTGKALFDTQAVLSRHYSEGSITQYQDKLTVEGQQEVAKLIQENEQVIGVELSDGSRRWFDEEVYSSFSEHSSEDVDTLLNSDLNNDITITPANGVTYAEAYSNAMESSYQDFTNSKVNQYRISAERLFSS